MSEGDELIGYVDGEFRIGIVSKVLKNGYFRVTCNRKEVSGKGTFEETIKDAIMQASYKIAKCAWNEFAESIPRHQGIDAFNNLNESMEEMAMAAHRFKSAGHS